MQKALIETALNGIEPYVRIVKEEEVIKFFGDLHQMIPQLLDSTVDLDAFIDRLSKVVTSYGNKDSTQ